MAMKPYGVELMNYIFGDFYRDTSILICLIVIWIMQKANRRKYLNKLCVVFKVIESNGQFYSWINILTRKYEKKNLLLKIIQKWLIKHVKISTDFQNRLY